MEVKDWIVPYLLNMLLNLLERYCDPLSEWRMTPLEIPRALTACRYVSMTRSAFMLYLMHIAIGILEYRSIIVDRYAQPRLVAMYVMSVVHIWFRCSGAISLTLLMMYGWELEVSFGDFRSGFLADAHRIPSWLIYLLTVDWATIMPSS